MRAAIKQKAFSPFQHNYFIIHITRGKMIRPSRNSRTTPASKSKPKPKPQPQQTQQTKPAPPSQRPPADGIAYVSKKEVKREKEEEQEDQNLILQPGLILMRQFLSEEEQILVQKQIWEMGRRDRKAQEYGGFYRPYVTHDSEAKMNLQMMCLGKHWNPVDRIYEATRSDNDKLPVYPIPENLKEICIRSVEVAQGLTEIPTMTPTAVIVNLYTENGRLGMHRDKTETEVTRQKGIPVVSFSIGDTGDFIYEVPSRGGPPIEKTIQLKSGDCLIFGGASRMIRHAVSRIYPGTSPLPHIGGEEGTGGFSLRCGRLNLTFREDGW